MDFIEIVKKNQEIKFSYNLYSNSNALELFQVRNESD